MERFINLMLPGDARCSFSRVACSGENKNGESLPSLVGKHKKEILYIIKEAIAKLSEAWIRKEEIDSDIYDYLRARANFKLNENWTTFGADQNVKTIDFNVRIIMVCPDEREEGHITEPLLRVDLIYNAAEQDE